MIKQKRFRKDNEISGTVTYGINDKFGKVIRLTYEDGSKIYINKLGLIITLPKKKFRKVWNNKRKDFEFGYNIGEVDLLLQAISKADKEFTKLEKKNLKSKSDEK